LPVPSPTRRGRCRLRGLPRSGRPPGFPPPLAEQRASSLPSIRPRRTLSRGSTPCEYPGCASRAALAVFHRLVAGARIRLSWGSSSLRRLQLQVPRLCRGELDPPREARDTTPPPGAALGFSQPLGGLSREDIRRARVAPNPPFTSSLRPGVSRSCYIPRRPWDSPFRAFPSRGAVPPLGGPVLPRGFGVDRDLRREDPLNVRPPSAARRVLAALGAPAKGQPCTTRDPGTWLPATVSPPHHHATFAARRLSERQRTSGLAGTRRSARLEALLPSGVRSRDRPRLSPELAPEGSHGRPGRCSPGISPLQSLLRHDLGFGSTATTTRGRTRAIAEVQAPLRTTEPKASILRSRPSGTSGSFGWPPSAPPTDAARVRAPLRQAPLPPMPFVGPRPLAPPGSTGTSEFSRSWKSVDLSSRSTSSPGVSYLGRLLVVRGSARRWLTRPVRPDFPTPYLAGRWFGPDRRSISSPRVRHPVTRVPSALYASSRAPPT